MNIRAILFLLIFMAEIFPIFAQFEFDVPLSNAYRQLALLKVDEGERLLKEYKAAGNRNGCTLLIENYADFIRLAISEDQKQYEALSPNEDKRLDTLENLDKNSPYYRYIKAQIIFQWALIKVKNGREMDGTLKLLKAYNLLEANRKQFPDFLYQNEMLGLFHILLGNMPAKYKGILKTFGFVPDMQLGLYELRKAVNETHIFQQESMMLICLIEHFILRSNENIGKLEALVKKEPNDLLASYLYASLLSKSSKGYLAYHLIQNLKQPAGALSFPYLHYLKGTLYLQKGEYLQAQTELKAFLRDFHGENYRKDTYYKLSLAANLKGDSLLANRYLDTIRLTGRAQVECDKHAESIASKHSLGNKEITHAMLLFDGGYLKEAKKILDEVAINSLNTANQLELLYRKARVYHELKLETEAIALYKQVITLQQEEQYYFAPNACLQLGYIYAKQDPEMAKLYFNKAMSYSGHEYENSINTKAKAAIYKLTNKQ